MILITHIESVREGVDRVITVRYDEETGASIVDGGDASEQGTGVDDQFLDDDAVYPLQGA